jgi:hypothetical protein
MLPMSWPLGPASAIQVSLLIIATNGTLSGLPN